MTHEANAAEYRELLGTILMSFAEEDGDDDFIYERDSAAKRTYVKKQDAEIMVKKYQGFEIASMYPRFKPNKKSLRNNRKKNL